MTTTERQGLGTLVLTVLDGNFKRVGTTIYSENDKFYGKNKLKFLLAPY